jgi:hypothetical protein
VPLNAAVSERTRASSHSGARAGGACGVGAGVGAAGFAVGAQLMHVVHEARA